MNSDEGHRAITDAAIEFGRDLGGLIDLGGDIYAPVELPGRRIDLP